MNLDDARNLIGCKVVYRAPHVRANEPGEEGVVTSVNSSYVFVRYGTSTTSAATPAECLESISP